MGTYTILSDGAIDAQIEKDLQHIVNGILQVLPAAQAITLVGGFGRGEGSVETKDGKVKPLNDYDLVVISGDTDKNRAIAELSVKLAKEIGIDFVDIGIIQPDSLGSLPPTIFNYEMKMGHRVLFGDPDILSDLPPYKPEDIPLMEGTRLLFNRGGGLIWAATKFVLKPELDEIDRRFVINQCVKAIQAIGDSLLLMRGKYHYLYSERRKLILAEDDLPLDNGTLKLLYDQAMKFKLEPDYSWFEGLDLVGWWFKIQQMHEKYFRFFEEYRTGESIEDWNSYIDVLLRISRASRWTAVKGLAKYIRDRGFLRPGRLFRLKQSLLDQSTVLYPVMPLVLYALTPGGIHDRHPSVAANVLKVGHESCTQETRWFLVAKKYIEVWHG